MATLCSAEDLLAAWEYARRDAADNFVFDVIDYEDIERNLPYIVRRLELEIKGGQYTPAPLLSVDIPKTPFSVRPGAVVSLLDLIVLYALVREVAPSLDAKLSGSVFSYRWLPEAKDRRPFLLEIDEDEYESEELLPATLFAPYPPFTEGAPAGWFRGWIDYHERVKDSAARYDFCAVGDVTAYFENVAVTSLFNRIGDILGDEHADAIALLRQLYEFWGWQPAGATAQGKVLPQGNDISLFLSNFFLTDLDQSMAEVVGGDQRRYLRYVDDVCVFTDDREEGHQILLACDRVLRDLNLNLNAEKTKVIPTAELFDDDVERWLEAMSPAGASAAESAREFLSTVYDEANVEKWERPYLRALTTLQREGNDYAVPTALKLFLENPSYKLLVKNFDYLSAFASRHLYADALAARLARETFTFPYHKHYLYRLGAYSREDSPALREIALHDARPGDVEWYVRMAVLFCLSSFRLTPHELAEIEELAERESHPAVARAALVALRQRPADEITSAEDHLLFTTAPAQENLREYFFRLATDEDLARAVLREIERTDVASRAFVGRLHQLDLLKSNAAVRDKYRAVLDRKLEESDPAWARQRDRLTGIKELASEEALRHSETRKAAQAHGHLENVLRGSHEAVIIADATGEVQIWNDAASELLGYTRDEALGRDLTQLIEPAGGFTSADELLDHIAESGGSLTEEAVPHHRPDDTALTVSATYAVIVDPSGEAAGLSVLLRDVTAEIRAIKAEQFQAGAEKLLANASARLVAPEDLDEAITQTLEEAAELLAANRAYLFRFRDDGKSLTVTHEWTAPKVASLRKNGHKIELERLALFKYELLDRHAVVVGDVETLPPAEKAALQKRGARASLGVPFYVGGLLAGLIGCDDTNRSRTWEPEEINLLFSVTALLSKALERKEAEEALQRSRDLVDDVFNAMNEELVVIGPDYKIRRVNRAFASRYGPKPEKLLGRPCYEVTHARSEPCSGAEHLCPLATVLETGQPFRVEHLHLDKDGDERIVEINASPVLAASGAVESVVEVSRDVTERRRAEEAVRRSAEEWERTFASVPEIVLVIGADYNVARANRAAAKCLGQTPAELVGRKCYRLIHGTDGPPDHCPRARVLASGEEARHEFYEPTLEAFLDVAHSPLNDADGGVVGTVVVASDVTVRKRAEEEIKKRLEFEKVVATISSRFAAAAVVDEAVQASLADMGRFSGAGRAYLFLLRDDGATMDNTHEWCAEGVEPQLENLQGIPADATPWWMAKLRADEVIRVADVSKLPAKAKAEREFLEAQNIKSLLVLPLKVGGELAGFVGFDNVEEAGEWPTEDLALLRVFAEDMGTALQRKRAEEALRASEEDYRLLFNSANDAVFVFRLGDDGKPTTFVDVNDVACKRYGYSKEELLALTPADLASPENVPLLPEIMAALRKEKHALYEWTHLTKDGKHLPVEVSTHLFELKGQPTVLSIVRDITARKRAEEALARRGEEITAVNELAIELATAASATEMFAKICTKLKDVTGALATITTSYDETRDELAVNYIVAETKVIKKGNKILGIDATKMRFPAERYEPEEMASDRVVISDGIPKQAYKNISKTVCKVIEKTFNLGEIYSLLLHHRGKMMGTAEVVMPKGSLPLSVDTLEAFAHVAAAALQRRRAEEALRASEEDYRLLFNSANDAVFVFRLGDDGKPTTFVDVNDVACKRYGYSKEELLALTPADLAPPENAPLVLERMATLQKEKHALFEWTHLRKDGDRFPVEISSHLFELRGRPTVLAVVRDVTARKRAEEALARRAEDMRALNDLAVELAAAPSAEAICEIAGERLREISGASAVILTEYDCAAKEFIIGYVSAPADLFKRVRKLIPGPINKIRTPIDDETYEEIISRRVKRHEGLHELTLGAVPKPLAAAIEKALGLGEIVAAGLQYAGALLGSGAVLMPKGRPPPSKEILENFANVTAAALGRRRAEETVRERSHDLGKRVKELNCLYTISRLVDDPDNTLEDIIRGTVDVIPASWQYPDVTCARVVIDGRGEFSTKKRRPADVVARQTADVNGGGKRAGTVEVGYCEEKPERDEGPFLQEERDLLNAIAERLGKAVEAKSAEAAFKESEERYRGLVEGAHDMVQSVAPDGRLLFVNRAWLETMAYAEEEIANLSLFDVIHPDYVSHCEELLRRVIGGESLAGIEAAFITKDGREVLVEGNAGPRFVDGKVVGTQGFFRDVTARKRGEEKIKRRLEFEEVVAVVSARFASGVEFDRAVTVSLADMGRFTAAGRAYLFLLRDDGAAVDNTHEWCAEGVEPQIDNLQGFPVEAIPWSMAKLRANEVLHIADVSTMPAEAKVERERFEAQEIKSLLVLPLRVGDELAGFVGFDNLEEAGKWEPEDLALLRVFAEVLGTSLERERAEKALQEARAQLERRVEERTAELDAANLDLRREVEERARAEEALRESEEKYRNIFEHSPAGIVIHQKGKILFVSPAMFRMVGYETAEEVVGKPVLKFIPPDRHKQHKEEVKTVLARGGELGQPTEQVLIRKDGSILDVTSVGQAITYDGAPAIQAFVVNNTEPKRAREALRDAHGQLEKRVEERTAEIKKVDVKLLRQIEERERAEESLRKSEREKAAVLENMPEQVVFRDREMTTIWGNKAAADWLGLTPRELVGRRCYEARYGRKEPCEDCDVVKSMDTGEPGEHETISPDGRVWSNRYSPVRDEAGGIIGVVETTLDITKRKRAEEAARRSAEEWERTFAGVPEMVLVIDADYNVTRANQAAAKRLGQTPDELVGRKCYRLIHGTDGPPDYCPHPRVLASGEEARDEFYEPALEAFLDVTHSPLKDADGVVVGTVFVASDVTVRKRAEEERRRRTEGYKALNELALELANAASRDEMYKLIGDRLKAITGAVGVIVNSLDPDKNVLTVEYVNIPADLLSKANAIIGRKVKKLRFPVRERDVERILCEKVTRVQSMADVAFGTISETVAEGIKKALGLGDIYGVALHQGGEVMGTAVALTGKDDPSLSLDELRIFGNQAATALRLKRAEEELTKYRNLVEEPVETGIKEPQKKSKSRGR